MLQARARDGGFQRSCWGLFAFKSPVFIPFGMRHDWLLPIWNERSRTIFSFLVIPSPATICNERFPIWSQFLVRRFTDHVFVCKKNIEIFSPNIQQHLTGTRWKSDQDNQERRKLKVDHETWVVGWYYLPFFNWFLPVVSLISVSSRRWKVGRVCTATPFIAARKTCRWLVTVRSRWINSLPEFGIVYDSLG